MKKTINWLIEDTHIFRYQYLRCDLTERKGYRKELFRYRNRFDNERDFFKWYLVVVN